MALFILSIPDVAASWLSWCWLCQLSLSDCTVTFGWLSIVWWCLLWPPDGSLCIDYPSCNFPQHVVLFILIIFYSASCHQHGFFVLWIGHANPSGGLLAFFVLKMCARGLQLQPPEGSLTFVLLCFIINSLREKSLENAAAYMNYPVVCLNLILFSLFLLAKLQWRKVSHLF